MSSAEQRLTLIDTVEELHYYLEQAIKLEHATIPPYLTALYSLKPGTNLEAFHIIRAVVVEEMLHLTLAANVLNAIGGNVKKVLTDSEFIPKYPTKLPTGETDFDVSLRPFSEATVKTFLNIERSQSEEGQNKLLVNPRSWVDPLLTVYGEDPNLTFYSIGAFYQEIIRGLFELEKQQKQQGKTLYCGDQSRQITSEYYYNGAGEIIPVINERSAMRALEVIREQGEGSRVGTIYDAERELSHFYRFEQLLLGQYYVINAEEPENSDSPHQPSGAKFTVTWDTVYPVKENASLQDYPQGSELYAAAQEFQAAYSQFLAALGHAFDGHPEALIPAVGSMFHLKQQANNLIRNPIPGSEKLHAAPIFRLDQPS